MTAPCQRPCPLRRLRAKTGLRLPASATLRLRLAGRCPNSSFLFPPLALGLRLLLFLQPLGGALKKQNAALASPPFICRWQQSAPLQSSPLLPKGEPLAYRTAFCQTPKVYSDVKDSALLQRAAASEQASLSSCCESLSQGTTFYDNKSFVRPAWALPVRQWLPLWGSWQSHQALTERALGKIIFTAKNPFWLSVVRVPLYF